MARIRTIKPETPQSESLGRCSRDARLLFIFMWTIADDSGRLRGNSRLLASLLYPYDEDATELIDTWIDELCDEGCIRRYDVNGSSYIDIPNWLSHQKIDKPSGSKLPEFVELSPNPRRNVAESSPKPRASRASKTGTGARKGREGKEETYKHCPDYADEKEKPEKADPPPELLKLAEERRRLAESQLTKVGEYLD